MPKDTVGIMRLSAPPFKRCPYLTQVGHPWLSQESISEGLPHPLKRFVSISTQPCGWFWEFTGLCPFTVLQIHTEVFTLTTNQNPLKSESRLLQLPSVLNQYCKTVPLTEGEITLISKCSTTFSWILSMGTILFLLVKGHLGTNFLSN